MKGSSVPGARVGSSHPLGFAIGAIVQEFYYDSDCDEELRSSIEKYTGHDLVDEDYSDVADGALVWWRSDDGDEDDLADLLVDATSNLDHGGLVWVLIPKPGRPGHVNPGDIESAASTVGLHSSSALSAGENWSGIRLIARSR